jgi:serine/threonine protein kinase
MITCPDPNFWNDTSEEHPELTEHLEQCETCRARIDAACDLKPWLFDRAITEHARSESLQRAIAVLTRSEPLPLDSATLPIGSRLGAIEIRRLIGRGGMGIVYEGIDTRLERRVAVKMLAPHRTIQSESAERFLREARSAASVTHDNILAIHAIEESAEGPYLVLPLIDGESLEEWLRREGQLPFETVQRIACETAAGLIAAHDRGLIHRDIKPANLLIERATGRTLIADFGLATYGIAEPKDRGLIAGTPGYMSPEQAAGGEIDARSDLFSLGVVIYQAVSGTHPFELESHSATMGQSRSADPPSLTGVPVWFRDAVMSLLAKTPANRPSSAREFLRRIQPPSTPWSRRRWMAAAGLVATGVAALTVAWPRFPKAEPSPSIPPPLAGFQIEGRSGIESTLSSAIASAEAGDTIIVHGDGPYPSPTIKIEGKPLTIRAASGSIPKFIPDSELTGITFLETNADLTLVGLDIRWPVAAPKNRIDDPGQRSVVSSRSGRLTIKQSRIVAGSNAFAVGSISAAGLSLFRSHLVTSTESGIAVGWQVSPNSMLNISECFLRAKIAILFGPDGERNNPPGRIVLERITIAAERAIIFAGNARNRTQAEITANQSLFDVSALISLFQPGGFVPQNTPTTQTIARFFLHWNDNANIYRSDIAYLGGNRPNSIYSFFSTEPRTLDAWRTFSGQPLNPSQERTIKFRTSIDSTDVAPESAEELNIGPPPNLVGPKRS